MSCFPVETQATSDKKRRFPLRATERLGIANLDVSIKCCHAIAITGDMHQLVKFLPTAVMRTFNRHPRLRALVVPDEKFTAEVQPPISLEDVDDKKLLRVCELSDSDEDAAAWQNWNQFVQSETHVPFDRYKQFMFYLTVWVNRAEGSARFFLFSDHIMSDGDSGQIFVNDTLEGVALLSIEAAQPVCELPLLPSLYDMWLTSSWWLRPLAKAILGLTRGSAFVNFMKAFKPVLTPREDQKDFSAKFEQNSTTLLSHAGNPSNMRDTLRKCKEEGVTVGVTLIPILVLAFYHASKVDRKLKTADASDDAFRLVADICYNMRQRVPHPAKENHVGLYVTNTPLTSLAAEGVNLKTTKFWDFARASKQQLDIQDQKLLQMAFPCFLIDRELTKPKVGKMLGDFKIPNSCTGDATISNLGRYMFKTKHILASNGVLEVQDMFAFCAIPFIATSSTVWLSTVHSFNYSLAHKVDEKVGSELFNAYVKICENASNIATDDTMENVLKRLGIEAEPRARYY
uniref:Alcohol acetyltransferase n=1 Tax=Peronospora matthiolae TaxID=2874970 RepID=A0AAV1VFT2_9STRA